MAVKLPTSPGAYRLEKAGTPIYVGSTDDLSRRYEEHRSTSHNTCIKQTGWDNFVYQSTETVKQAEILECAWYQKYQPKCNLVAPPHCNPGGQK
jgi:excinuclease UvrABC nuclease subunit